MDRCCITVTLWNVTPDSTKPNFIALQYCFARGFTIKVQKCRLNIRRHDQYIQILIYTVANATAAVSNVLDDWSKGLHTASTSPSTSSWSSDSGQQRINNLRDQADHNCNQPALECSFGSTGQLVIFRHTCDVNWPENGQQNSKWHLEVVYNWRYRVTWLPLMPLSSTLSIMFCYSEDKCQGIRAASIN